MNRYPNGSLRAPMNRITMNGLREPRTAAPRRKYPHLYARATMLRRRLFHETNNTSMADAMEAIEAGDAKQLATVLDSAAFTEKDLAAIASALSNKITPLQQVLDERLSEHMPAPAAAPGSEATGSTTAPGSEAMSARRANVQRMIAHERSWERGEPLRRQRENERTAEAMFSRQGTVADVDAAAQLSADWYQLRESNMTRGGMRISRERYIQLNMEQMKR